MQIQSSWAERELLRITTLPNDRLIMEVHNAMNAHTYSWKSIQSRIELITNNDDILLDWDGLCNLKKTWDSIPSLTRERQYKDVSEKLSQDPSRRQWDLKHLRTLLISLKLILIRAGVKEEEVIRLVSQNIDEYLQHPWFFSEKMEQNFVVGAWDSAMDEETPLLGNRILTKPSFWAKLLSWK